MTLFDGAPSVRARALYLGERIDVRALENTQKLALTPLSIQVGERGLAVIFRYGAVVLLHVPPLEEVSLLEQLKKFIGDPLQKPESEEVEIRIAPDKPDGLEAGIIYLADFALERLQLIAEILARSVALARSEAVVRETGAIIESWAQTINQTGSGGALEKQLRKHLGSTLVMQYQLAGRVEVGDKPDILWDRPDLERIYARLEDEYELKDRDKTLERKLALITATAETLLNLMANKHSNRLEWYIIILILFEIGLTLFTMITGVGAH